MVTPENLILPYHIPVLSQEVIAGLNIRQKCHYLDVTVGGGGHSKLILAAASEVRVTAIDRDVAALTAAQAKLAEYGEEQVQFWQGNFANYPGLKANFDGIVADLGVSSAQLDIAERGFSFRQEAALDMRMDRNQKLTAAEIINHWQETQLADIFFKYGEERFSRRIARRIVSHRPLQTTTQLAQTIAACVPRQYRYGRIHPATRVFQALRIVVNGELEALEKLIAKAPEWLKPDGIIAIISFHSLEDRIVKHGFKNTPQLQVLTKKPITASETEKAHNPRSRSAKLRLAQRV